MTDLSEFLLARIAEDEAQCRQEIADGYGGWQHESGWPSYRVLAECAAKRRIVEDFGTATATLTALASVYADHPDYDEDWRP